jgi:hypothetical protein
MQYLRYLTLGLGAAGLVLTQLSTILPEGKTKHWVGIASAFLAALPITVFNPPVKRDGMFDGTPTAKLKAP